MVKNGSAGEKTLSISKIRYLGRLQHIMGWEIIKFCIATLVLERASNAISLCLSLTNLRKMRMKFGLPRLFHMVSQICSRI